ncbi:MAG: hypothetical protein PHO02_01495 [Candidatus Nanoarchaeia archaeon]|nr:hypothetical protein [Candidatus Nanoarchaeia archaeon]
MGKKSFFRQPNVSEIFDGKKRIDAERKGDLVALINSCMPSFAIYIDFPILPKHYNRAKHFLKYGNEAMASNLVYMPPRQAIAEALHYANPPFASFAVRSKVDNTTVTRTLLDTAMQGMKLYAYSVNNAPIDVKGPYRKPADIAEKGADFVVSVPSEEMKGDRHTVRFSNVPLYDNYQKKRMWTDIGAICDCDFSRWWITSRYAKEKLFCQHAVAAYFAIAFKAFKEGYATPSQSVPFPMFSEEAAEFWNKMRKHVVANKGKHKMPLNSAERSLLLGEYIKIHGVKEALYHGGKKAADFSW